MAVARQDPYPGFNYNVTIVPRGGGTIRGAFAEVSGIETEIAYAEYRDGTDPSSGVRKIPLNFKVSDLTLKRGLIGALDLWNWTEMVRQGNADAKATVTIELKSEDNQNTVATWELTGARPMKWTGPTLTAKGASDVAMEELVLVYEDLNFS